MPYAISDALWIILTGSLISVACALPGCFLVLRKMAMVGDAISHAVLPGIVISFLLAGSRDSLSMLFGASICGVVSTVLIEFFHRKGKLQSDAAIGVTFTWLFAVGVILISLFAGQTDLDTDCVLHGEIAYVPLDILTTSSGMELGPRAVWILGIIVLLVIVNVVIGYKGLLITTFDAAYSSAIGIATGLWHYMLMSTVSVVTVASFESVGAILVVSFLVIPPATAYLLTNKLHYMLMFASFFGILSSIFGYFLAIVTNGSIAGSMGVVASIFFLFALFFSPSQGIFRRVYKPSSHKKIKAPSSL